jgi:hypothetical protein
MGGVAVNGEAKWERLAAATGVLFVVLLLVSVFMVPAPPDVNAAPRDIASYFSDHRTALLISGYLAGLAAVAFLWFLGSLVSTLRRAEGDHPRLSIVCVAAGAVTAAIALAAAGLSATLAYSTALHADGGAVRALFVMSSVGISFIVFSTTAFVASASVLMIRTGAISRWIGEAGVVFAILMLVAGASYANSGPFEAGGVMGLVALLSFALWVLMVSGRMVMQLWPRRASMAAPAAQ